MLPWILLAAAAAALVGAGARRFAAGYAPRPAETLAPRELAFLAAAADAMFPPGGPVPPSGSEAGIPEHTDRYVTRVGSRMRLLMRLLFVLVEHATLVFPAPPPGGRRRFSSLSPEQRVAVLEGWRTSRLFPRRLVFTSLRAILAMGYFADPAVLRRLELAPYAIDTPVVEADLLYPPVGRGKDAIPFSPPDLTPRGPVRPLDLDGPLHPDCVEPVR